MVDILKLSRVQFLFKMLHTFITSLLYRRSIIVLIGDSGAYLAAFNRRKVVDTLFISSENKENLHLYEQFFDKFRKFRIFFLLDSAECKLRHDIVPVLQSIVKANPIEKFIEEYFPGDEIVGYNVYNVNTKAGESWNTMIVSTPYKPPLSILLDRVLSKGSPKFGGIHFLSLEFGAIIDRILAQINCEQYSEYLQIFICVLETNGIKIVVKHYHNIISIKNIAYPNDKSQLYLQGILEQEIADCLISLKNYIANHKAKVCIIFIVEQNLAELLGQSQFGEHQVIRETVSKIFDKTDSEGEKFLDYALTSLFNDNKLFPASNQNLVSISKLYNINAIIFKPLIVVIIALIASACLIKIKTINNYKQVDSLNAQYFSVEKNYYDLKQKYPYIQNATNLADIYVFETLLQIPVPTPFSTLEKFLKNLDQNFLIDEIKWERLNLENMSVLSGRHIQIEIFLKFNVQNMTLESAQEVLTKHIESFNKVFSPMKVTSTILADQIVDFSKKVIIPIQITIID